VPTDVGRRLDALAARHWSTAEEVNRITLGSGESALTLYGPPSATAAFLDTLTNAGDALHDASNAADELRARVEQLERARDAAAADRVHLARSHAAPARGAAPHETATARHEAHRAGDGSDGTTLESVPASLIAPFHPDARTLTAAKENPLVALAVQATKAMQTDASELERARLLAMAYAAATGDLERFWTARAQRSAKKLQTPERKSKR